MPFAGRGWPRPAHRSNLVPMLSDAPAPAAAAAVPAARFVHYAGRAGDRNPRGMSGAALLASAIAAPFGLKPVRIGAPAPPLGADWRVELDAALPELRALQAAARTALAAGPALFVLNRCAAALATLPAVAAMRPDAAIVWFDAHGDCNVPERTTSGYLGGLVLTAASGAWDSGLGAGLQMENVLLVGARDLDPSEADLVAGGRIRLVPAGPDLAARLRAAVAGRPVYVHLDCDALEPGLVPTEYAVPAGLDFADLASAAAVLAESELVGLELAEFESEWSDGAPGDPAPLLDALAPLLARWRG